MENPFTPTFGIKPEEFASRQGVMNLIREGVEYQDYEARKILISGVRGSGKTVILKDVEKVFNEDVVVFATAGGSDLLNQIKDELTSKYQITFNFSLLGNSASVQKQTPTSTSGLLKAFASKVTATFPKRNFILTIDEVSHDDDEVVKLVQAVQSVVSDYPQIMLIMAGLPENVDGLVNGKHTSFLRRSKIRRLGALNPDNFAKTYVKLFAETNIAISSANASLLANYSYGYPYAIQWLGSEVWKRAKVSGRVTQNMVEGANFDLKAVMYEIIKDSVFRNSELDTHFLSIMAQSPEYPIDVGYIVEQLDRKAQQIQTYKQRLLNKGLIRNAGHGRLAFMMPYMKEYLNNPIIDDNFDEWDE
ncbi:MAG: ATP-binding protein [Lactobacillaceae bacterium]|jgi:hypothetical protein|nr:ATP-binding protein [Lactobacillaceae bacterium]